MTFGRPPKLRPDQQELVARLLAEVPNSIELFSKLCRQLDVISDWLFFGDARALPAGLRRRLETALQTVELVASPPARD